MVKNKMNCRFCKSVLTHTFVNLGETPLANSLLHEKDLEEEEKIAIEQLSKVSKRLYNTHTEIVEKEKLISDHFGFKESMLLLGNMIWFTHNS